MRTIWTVLAAMVIAIGCGKSGDRQEITETREVTAPAAGAVEAPAASSAERFGFQASPAAAPAAKPGGGFTYKVPEGWKEQPPTQFRLANFTAGPNGEVEAFLSTAGGGVAANANRWRQQLGLEPLGDAELAQLPKKQVLGKEAVLVNWEGTYGGMQGAEKKEGYRLAGVILENNGEGVFVKMVGPAAAVEQELGRLEEFAQSLQVDPNAAMAGGDPHAGMAMPGGDPHAGMVMPGGDPHAGMTPEQVAAMQMDPSMSTPNAQFDWTAPEGWQQGPEKPMRAVTFKTPDGAEAYVSVLSGPAGGAVANINRWASQMGVAQPMTPDAIANLPKIDVMGKPSPLVELSGEFKGMGGEAQTNAALLGTVCELPEQTVFVKMTGPEAAVKANKDKFVAFSQSLTLKQPAMPAASEPQPAPQPQQ